MAPIFDQIMKMLATPQGNLIYPVVLGLITLGALQACGYANYRQRLVEGKRFQWGLLILLIAQGSYFVASWLAVQGVFDSHKLLPPLSWLLALFSLVLIIWLWAVPKPNLYLDGLIIIIELLILLAGIISIFWWMRQDTDVLFNASIGGAYAFYIGVGLLLAGLLLVIFRMASAWAFGFFMLLVLLAGYMAQFFIRQPAGDFALFVRLGEMVAYPILLALPRRLIYRRIVKEPIPQVMSPRLATNRIDGNTLQSIVDLSSETSPQQYYLRVTRLVTLLMDADVCLLVMPPKVGGQLIVPVGYNRLVDRIIEGFTINGINSPLLNEAIMNRKSLRVNDSEAGSEIRALTDQLGVKHVTHLLEVPINLASTNAEMGILVLSKPDSDGWSEKDELWLAEISKVLASNLVALISKGDRVAVQEEAQREEQRAQLEIDTARQEFAELQARYDALDSQYKEMTAQFSDQAIINESQKSLQDEIAQLQARNRELENMVSKGRPSIEEVEQLRQELRAALTDLARIPTTLSKSDQKMLEMQLSTVRRLDTMGQTEMVTSIAQEFRQPLSSILGYTELLLGESTGLLGAMQRKFLERVKASTERLRILLDELVEVLAIDSGKIDQTPSSVDLKTVIDEAIENIGAQIIEKKVTMQVDIPEELPTIQANKDAFEQILANLLQNACMVTPEGGEIQLFARVEHKEDGAPYLHLSVSDQGGGVEKVDVPRIFSRRYKMENPLIQGIGDTGVGLSIVKSLVELYKGRIWVDTKEGVGSTFSLLIPLAEEPIDKGNSPTN